MPDQILVDAAKRISFEFLAPVSTRRSVCSYPNEAFVRSNLMEFVVYAAFVNSRLFVSLILQQTVAEDSQILHIRRKACVECVRKSSMLSNNEPTRTFVICIIFEHDESGSIGILVY